MSVPPGPARRTRQQGVPGTTRTSVPIRECVRPETQHPRAPVRAREDLTPRSSVACLSPRPCPSSSSINVSLGPKEDRVLTTGLHTVCDIFCTTCEENIGWFYEQAFEESQKYKEGPPAGNETHAHTRTRREETDCLLAEARGCMRCRPASHGGCALTRVALFRWFAFRFKRKIHHREGAHLEGGHRITLLSLSTRLRLGLRRCRIHSLPALPPSPSPFDLVHPCILPIRPLPAGPSGHPFSLASFCIRHCVSHMIRCISQKAIVVPVRTSLFSVTLSHYRHNRFNANLNVPLQIKRRHRYRSAAAVSRIESYRPL